MPNYALDNASPHGTAHLSGLTGMFDRFTAARIGESADLKGARCLELGAGNGSVAAWLAEQVGPQGQVTATDIEVRHIPAHDRLAVLRHDLLTEPVPAGPFDLIHARCLMGHLPNRAELLPQLCQRLAPGGTLLLEDFNTVDLVRTNAVLHAPPDPPNVAELWNEYERLRGEFFAASGTNGSFITKVHGLMLDLGLTDVETVTYCRSWRGGEPGSRHAGGTLQQFRPRLAERGFSGESVDVLVAALDDPQFHVAGRLLCSTSGRAPG
jgi:SAM-dependent methyltransferase